MARKLVVGRPEIEAEVLKIVKEAGRAVSVDYVAYHLGVSWGTARALLLGLAAKGKLKMIDTTKGPVFASREWTP